MSQNSNKNTNFTIKKLLLIVLVLSPILGIVVSWSFISLLDPDEHSPRVSFFGNPHEQVYISWETKEMTTGVVWYGTDKDDLSLSQPVNQEARIHHVNLTNLSPDTKYFYEVRIEGEFFGRGEFRTAPLDQKEFTFGIFADTQQLIGLGHHFRLANVLKDKDYAFVACVGDLVEHGFGFIDHVDKRFYNNFFKVSSSYMETIPFVPVVGNHDARGMDLFRDYFINQVDPTDDLFFYSFSWSNVHFTIAHFG